LIQLYFRNESFCQKTLKGQKKSLQDVDPLFGCISDSKYYKFLKDEAICEYKQFEKISPNEMTVNSEQIKIILSRIVMDLQIQGETVLYYDTTVVHDFSFKKKSWIGPSRRNRQHLHQQIKFIKVLTILDNKGLVSLQIIKKSEADDILNFISNTIDYARSKSSQKRIWLFLDNAFFHKSEEFKKMADDMKIHLIYNAISNPKFNLVEDFFELIKREIRNKYQMSPRQIILSLLNQAKEYSRYHSLRVKRNQLNAFEDCFQVKGHSRFPLHLKLTKSYQNQIYKFHQNSVQKSQGRPMNFE
jgi:transposase